MIWNCSIYICRRRFCFVVCFFFNALSCPNKGILWWDLLSKILKFVYLKLTSYGMVLLYQDSVIGGKNRLHNIFCLGTDKKVHKNSYHLSLNNVYHIYIYLYSVNMFHICQWYIILYLQMGGCNWCTVSSKEVYPQLCYIDIQRRSCSSLFTYCLLR